MPLDNVNVWMFTRFYLNKCCFFEGIFFTKIDEYESSQSEIGIRWVICF